MAKLFVSYSRRDSTAARKLIEAFRSIDQDVWVDWESIPPAVDWLEQIFRGIEESDAFIFLISPDSIASEVCKVEVNRAAQNNKRIIPIVLRDVHPNDTPESIRKLNWTYLRETDIFEEGLAKVRTAILLDLDWLEEHRRLQVRALEWHRKKDTSLLLHGRDLRNARRMVETATSKDPPATELQSTYIKHSLRSERNRTVAWLATGVALIIMAVLSLIAVNQSQVARQNEQVAVTNEELARDNEALAIYNQHQAEENALLAQQNARKAEQARDAARVAENLAEAQRSAARAQIFLNRPGELFTSTLLAIDSMRRQPSDEAEEILRRNLSLLPLPVTQLAQGGKINDLVLNQQGDTLFTASADGTVCAWSIEEEKVSSRFCTPSNGVSVNTIALSRDGSFLAAGDQAGRIQVIDPQTGKVLHEFARIETRASRIEIAEVGSGNPPEQVTPENVPIRSISTRPTRAQLISVTYDDGEIAVFDPNTGKISSRLSVTSRPNVSEVSPNGAWLVVGPEAGQVTIWHLGTGKQFSTSLHRGGVLAMAFSPRENKVVTAGSDTIAVTNLSTEKELYRIPIQSPVRDIVFSPDGSWFVTVSDDHRIRVWDTSRGNERLTMSQDGVVTQVVVSANSKWIATTGSDRTARVWDAATGAEIFQIPLKGNGARLAFWNEDKWLVSTDETGAIAIWDISVMTLPALSVPASGIVSHVQYSPSGEWLALSSQDKLWLLRTDRQTILQNRGLGQPAHDFNSNVKMLTFSPDSKALGLLTEENEVGIYNLEDSTLHLAAVSEPVQSIAFRPDHQQLITSDSSGTLQAWSVPDAERLADAGEFPEGSSLASGGGVLAIGTPDEVAILSNDSNGSFPAIRLNGDKTLLVASADGSRLASSDLSGNVTLLQYESDQLTQLTSFAKGQVASLAFNPKGTLLAVGTARNVYLMDVVSGKEVARIPHMSVVNGVSFSPDGAYLATASSQALQFWNLSDIRQVRSDELITFACAHLYENLTPAQWEQFFAGETYEPLCQDLPTP